LALRQPLGQKAISWLVVALGALPGVYGLVMLAQSWVPENHTGPDWFTPWLRAAGEAALGLVFLTASFAALRHRRRAGMWFLLSAPIAVFCFAFEDPYMGAPFREYDWRSPSLPIDLMFVCLFFIPLYVPLFATRNRKRAAFLFLILALLSGLAFRLSPWSPVLLPRIVACSVPFLVFGAFWLGTGKLGWPALAAARPKSLPKRLAAGFAGCVLVGVLVVLGTSALSARQSAPWGWDCEGRVLFARPLEAGHAVFTARAIHVGHATMISGRWAGGWAIGLVQKRFWGLPWWSPYWVLLTNYPFWEGETYFVDGTRDTRLLNRFLPIVEAGPCTRTGPLARSTVEMRLLQAAPGPSELGIVGRVVDERGPVELRLPHTQAPIKWDELSDAEIHVVQEQLRYHVVAQRVRDVPIPNARVRIIGSSGVARIVSADRNGFYQALALPADDYRLELLDVPGTQRAASLPVGKPELLQERFVRSDVYVHWDGAIEGRVGGLSGGPAEVWLELGNADGALTGNFSRNQRTDKSGAFRFEMLPPGRYTIRINSDGPREYSPYAPLYYPSSMRPEDARVFEVAEGHHIQNVVFALKRLAGRILQVRVTWPNGQPADGAQIGIAYEHTEAYERPTVAWGGTTDQGGVANVEVFGGSRIRAWAEERVDEGRRYPAVHYSVGAEIETDKLPRRLDLVVSSKKHPFR
jgi:hypothetical protein